MIGFHTLYGDYTWTWNTQLMQDARDARQHV